ncbi:MAG: HEAT repeat domain-containing protein [Chloroflexaceae bacterium]|nr:HEAT repeat domain-containing protein [Chloroflexaceae bacterium]
MLLFGRPNIEKLKQKRDIAALVRALDYERDPSVEVDAARGLGELGGEQALEHLTRTLQEMNDGYRRGNEDLCEAILFILPELAPEHAMEPLSFALKQESLKVRRAAATGLGKVGNEYAIESLLMVLKRRDRDMYRTVGQSLAYIGLRLDEKKRLERLIEPLAQILRNDRLDIRDPGIVTLEWMGWERDGSYVPPTDDEMNQDKKDLRAVIFESLEQMGWQPDQSTLGASYHVMRRQWDACVAIGQPAAEPLISALKDDDQEVCKGAFQTLVRMGKVVGEDLIEALKHEKAVVRQASFQALHKIGIPILHELVASLEHENPEVRRSSAIMLGQLRDPGAVLPLIHAFRDIDWDVRAHAYKSMMNIGPPALPALVAALRHQSEAVRWGAAGTLEAFGWKPTADATGAAYWIIKGDWYRCIQIGPPAIEPLIDMFEHWDKEIARKAMATLVQIGAPAVEPLIAALTHESSEGRIFAALTLGMIGDERAIPPLTERLADETEADAVREALSEALNALQPGHSSDEVAAETETEMDQAEPERATTEGAAQARTERERVR